MKQISVLIILALGLVFLLAFYDIEQELMQPAEIMRVASPPSIDISKLSLEKKKQYFIEKTLPAIINVKQQLDEEYAYILALSQKASLTRKEKGRIKYLKKRYKAKSMQELLLKLHTHPASIVLAQAALETGWGTSRFYTEANNIFGIWSYNKKEPRIAASETRGTKTIFVKKYASLEESIEDYFRMMASGRAYGKFRAARAEEENPFKLIKHLTHYSELRNEYVRRLYYVIRGNRFYTYDTPSFAPIALSHILPEMKKEQAQPEQIRQIEIIPDSNTTAKPDTSEHLSSGTDINATGVDERNGTKVTVTTSEKEKA